MDLREIQAPVQSLLDSISDILKAKFRNTPATVRRILNKTPAHTGKRIRPTLLFLLAGARECRDPQLSRIATEMELLHLSSLIHDDVMDHSTMRRGRRSLNMDEGNQMSILWGDYLFVNAFRGLHSTGRPVAAQVAMDVAASMIEGQMLELDHQNDLTTSRETYLEIISLKTGSLFSGIARIAASLDAPSQADVEAFASFGTSLGILFQMRDDLIDIFSHQSGKDRYRDLKEGKITLPVILLLQRQGKKARALLRARDFTAVGNLLRREGVPEEIDNHASELADSCRSFLQNLPDSPYRKSLLGLVDFIGSREY